MWGACRTITKTYSTSSGDGSLFSILFESPELSFVLFVKGKVAKHRIFTSPAQLAASVTIMTEQIELFAIDNPCIGRCESNKKGYCFGCLRNRTERQLWQKMTNTQKREVLRLIQGRKQRIEKRLLENSRQQTQFQQTHQSTQTISAEFIESKHTSGNLFDEW